MTTTQTLEEQIHANCATCPYFQDFGEPNGRGWCKMFDQMARRHHKRTGDCDQEIEAVAQAQQPAPPPIPQPKQPAGFSFDSTRRQLQDPNESPIQLELEPQAPPKLETEFDLGRRHGRNDALAGWHPIYFEPVTEYARGYLSGYNARLNPASPQPEASLPLEWSVTWNQRWGWYEVWLNQRWIGRAATSESAERMATKRIALNSMIEQQNRAVMPAYAFGT